MASVPPLVNDAWLAQADLECVNELLDPIQVVITYCVKNKA